MTFETKFSGVKDGFGTGATRDAAEGKGRFDLIPGEVIARLAGVYERGAVNHGDDNWRNGIPFSRLYSSALRHLFQAKRGLTDEDHICQAIWNLVAIAYFQEHGRIELDDTYEGIAVRQQVLSEEIDGQGDPLSERVQQPRIHKA